MLVVHRGILQGTAAAQAKSADQFVSEHFASSIAACHVNDLWFTHESRNLLRDYWDRSRAVQSNSALTSRRIRRDVMNDEQRKLLETWRDQAKQLYRAHYASSVKFHAYHKRLGYPECILSAIVTTAVFAALRDTPTLAAKITVTVVTAVITVLTAMQTFLRLPERAEKHQSSGAGFAAIHREAAELIAFPPTDQAELRKIVGSLRLRWNELSRASLVNEKEQWDKAIESMRSELKG
jgi:hypothetical protein